MRDADPILIICPLEESSDSVVTSVLNCGLQLRSCTNYREARSLLEQQNFSAVLCSDSLADGTYSGVVEAVKPIPVIVLLRLAEWKPYLTALRAGAFDYIACPPDPAEMERILSYALNEYSQVHGKALSAA